MKRATSHPVRALLLQVTSIRLNDPHQISPVFQVVNEVLVVEHGKCVDILRHESGTVSYGVGLMPIIEGNLLFVSTRYKPEFGLGKARTFNKKELQLRS
jgi:hypothetical protein